MFRRLFSRTVQCAVPVLAGGAAAVAEHKTSESYAWGGATFGETGHGHELVSVGIPRVIEGLHGVGVQTLVSSGTSTSSAALTNAGSIYSFGCGAGGRLGHGDMNSNQLMPRQIDDIPEPVAAVAMGEFHGMALTKDGRLYGWGKRAAGHDSEKKGFPAPVKGLDGVRIVQVACGREHTVAIDSDGRAYSWGVGSSYALGHGSKEEVKYPRRIEALKDKKVLQAACGREHTLLLLEGGEVWAFGTDAYGQCGAGFAAPYVKAPARVRGALVGKTVLAVFAGEGHSVALCDDHAVYTWGSNKHGTLGHGDTSDLGSPRLLEAPLGGGRVVDVAAGGGHTLLLTDLNALWACGRGRSGQLGRGDALESVAAYRTVPVEVHGLPADGAVVSIAAGRDHSLAVVEYLR